MIDDDDEPSPPKKSKHEDEDLQLAIQLSLQGDEAADSDDVSSNADSDFIDVPEWDNRDIEWPHTSFNDPLEIATNVPPSPDPSKSFGLSDLLLPVSEESKQLLFKDILKETKLEVIIRPDEAVNLKDDMFADVFAVKTSANILTADVVPVKEVVKAKIITSTSVRTVKEAVKVIPVTSVVTVPAADILNELKLQMDDIEKITVETLSIPNQTSPQKTQQKAGDNVSLTDIHSNLNSEMDRLSDSILVAKTKDVKSSEEVIEIDDDDDDNVAVAPPKISKQSSISAFIDITLTPKKPSPDQRSPESPHTPKIASPFFRKKTPSSKKKSPETVVGNASNVAKSLFATTEEVAAQSVATSNPAAPAKTAEDFVAAAASLLRTLKTTDELTELADTAQQESYDLRQERNKQDRFGSNITERMSLECKQLLRMFGIPYIVAPKEAEAQCAYLDAANFTDGTITDDSDIWLFGGKTVYKHFFNQQKNVMEFRAETVERSYNVERNKLIQLAMLVGSDYTTGKFFT